MQWLARLAFTLPAVVALRLYRWRFDGEAVARSAASVFDSSRHCSACDIYWPNSRSVCPRCKRLTKADFKHLPISREEAKRLAAEADFDIRYMLDHELPRIMRGEPTPEDIAHSQVSTLIALDRQLEAE